MRLLRAHELRSVPVRAKVGFSARSSVVGAFVVFGYAASLVALKLKTDIPLFMIVVNVPLWAFFFWYWQRHLRRLLGGHRSFALAVSDRAILFPLNHLDRTVPDELDLYLEVPAVRVAAATFVDQRTVVRHRHTHQRTVSNVQTPSLRLRLREPLPPELGRALDAIRERQGFQGLHVHVAEPDLIEVFLHASQARAVEAALVHLDPRLKPAREVTTLDLREGADAQAFDAALGRLESAGHVMVAAQARRLVERSPKSEP